MKRVLLDHGVPAGLRTRIEGDVFTAFRMGWAEPPNGELIAAAETGGFDVFITCDQNLRYQQALVGRRLAIVVLRTTAWPIIAVHAAEIATAVASAEQGSYRELLDRSGEGSPGQHTT